MNKYRSHTCGELTIKDNGKNISLSGWINKKRDHGNLLFLDLRDNYGVTQCVIDNTHQNFTYRISLIILKSIAFFFFKLNSSTLYIKSAILPYDLSILLVMKSISFLSI